MNSTDPKPLDSDIAAEERRLHPRYTVRVQIEIHPEDTDIPMRLETTDLSRSGCYIQLMMPFAVGVKVRVTLWLDGRAIVIHGQVVTCHTQFGNGVRFVEFEGAAQQLLDRYLADISD
jgi:c-di-GMP-binding flagellar brake protein YcgR